MAFEDKKVKSTTNSCGCLLDDVLKGEDVCDESAGEEILVDPDAERISHEFYLHHLTDGLPIIPPTRDRVDKFLEYSKGPAQQVVAILPPRRGKATVEKIAINAVMAGCMPNSMPVVEQAIGGLGQEEFNLAGINATTHPVSICTLVNGPESRDLGMNSGVGCLGPGNLANSTIGRAIRLCMLNIAGAIPGVGDHATHGSPAKYSYAFAEAEEQSPWEALHIERGFQIEDSTVTVLGMEAPHNVNDHRSICAEDLLDTVAHTASTAGCNNSHVPGEILVIMSPEHAITLNKDGWNKKDVKNYLHQKMVVPTELGDRGGRKLDSQWKRDDEVRITRKAEDVVLVVAGGPGRHTLIAHGFGSGSKSVTIPLNQNSY
ncbi:MAG: hypothetical protein ABFC91_00720 [Methanobacteriaceae archaeon]